MKPYKSLLFIASLMLGLAFLSACFPPEGVSLWGLRWNFPSLASVLRSGETEEQSEDVVETEEIEELSPEELMAQRLQALHAARDSEFSAYITTSPNRIYMPEDDVTYFDPVFEALLNASRRPMRIMHYGDSQLECDRITDVFREHLQSNFGGSGAGLLPAMQIIATTTARVVTSPELPRYVGFGASPAGIDGRRYGPMAQMAVVDGEATFSLTATGGKSYPHAGSFRKVSVAVAGEGSLTLRVGENEYELTTPSDTAFQDGLHVFSRTLPSAVSRATVVARGRMDVYGLMVDGAAGVSVDNIAMRGASGTHFTATAQSTLAPFFRHENVPLIILQYGGNSVPYLKSTKSISNYKHQLMAQISLLKRLSPGCRILFVGPADMATTDGEEGHMRTYPRLPEVVDSLKAAALESGVAFWDMFHIMGGKGSIVRWVNACPQLAGEDYIHFTPKGARYMGDLLWKTMDFYYRYYRFRHGLDKEELEDSTSYIEHEDTLQNIALPASPAARRS